MIRERNSSRVFAWSRKQPSMQLVIVVAPGFCTPRMAMHMCLRSEETRKRVSLCESLLMTRSSSGHSRSLHDDGNPSRLDGLLDRERDLLRQSLLDLQSSRESLCDSGELGDTENELVGDVGNVD